MNVNTTQDILKILMDNVDNIDILNVETYNGCEYNTTGFFQGINFNQQYNKWRACITENYKLTSIGYYNSKKDAIVARNDYIIDNKLESKHNVYNITVDKLIITIKQN